MIQGIIDTVIETASPAITKWRSFFLIVSLILVSPELDKLFSQNFYSIDLKSSISLLGELLSSSKALMAAFLALLFYFVIPFINSWMLKYLISKNIPVAESLIDQIEKLRKSPKEDIERIIEESFDGKKAVASSSVKTIDVNKERAEIASMACTMYLVTSLCLGVFNIFVLASLLILYASVAYIISKDILISYLRNVAPYKVLEDYVKYVVLVK